MKAQAVVEFALTIGVFLSLLLAAVSASLYAIERGAAVTGVAAAARVAAGATPGNPDRPYLEGAGPAFLKVMEPVRFGSRLRVLATGQACPPMAQVQHGEVQLCTTHIGEMVKVQAVGWPANPLGAWLGFSWPLDVAAEVHQVTFAR
jgi:hypothetical protein